MRYLAFFMSFVTLLMVASCPLAQEPEPAPSIIIMEQPRDGHPFSLPVDPDLYLIRPGDELQITFVQSQLQPMKLMVDPEGRIVDKTLGAYDLAFKTLTQAREILGGALAELYNIPGITIGMVSSRSVSINVTGAVTNPGTYDVFTSQKVSDVIEMAGGITSEGSRRRITFNGGPNTVAVDLDRAIFLGDNKMDPDVYAGQVIDVPNRSTNTVQVVGEVRHPREIELMPGDDLPLLLSLAGGVRRSGNQSNIQIISGTGSGNKDELKAGDIIFVPPLDNPPEESFISVFGAVKNHGLVGYRSGMTLSDALEASGGTLPDANTRQTTVFRNPRLDSEGRTTTQRYAVSDPAIEAGNFSAMKLQPEDSIYVPVRVGYVTVTGAVRYPGNFPFAQGKDALFYIQAAGGFLATSNKDEISVFNPVSKITTVSAPGVAIRDGAMITVDIREELK